MHLNPERMKAAYEYLRTTPPFKSWKLPDGDEISWRVNNSKKYFGECGSKYIAMSQRLVKTTDQLMRTLAHEVCHYHLDRQGVKSHHGQEFQKLAKSVCKHHGWREELF